ncbi:tetratricopeptide repeat protein [Roseibium sp.]|uniref:tetratricopeptide repeat protein n=1 Tax=Roseibium sp. TaxID=1936156 RepID=UPI003A96D5FC
MTFCPEVSDDPSLDEADIRRQLDLILDYADFQASSRRRELLTYIVEEALAGRASGLKATTIAMAVFDRGSDFDQQTDPVVRLEARKLRRDLDHYYADAGRDAPVRISIPKGHYIPRFSKLNTAEQVEELPLASVSAAVPDELVTANTASIGLSEKQPGRKHLHLALIVTVLLCVAALALFWGYRPGERTLADSDLPVDGAGILVEGFEARGTNDNLASLLAAGLSQEITAALLKFPDLRVYLMARQGTAGPGPSEAARLHSLTQFVLNGSVWREDGDLLVRAELVRNKDARVLWSHRYKIGANERSIADIQDEISSRVASVVGQQYGIVRSELKQFLISQESNPSLSSYACVARAEIYRRTLRLEEYLKTRACLEEAVQKDPEYARAWAMLAYLRNDAVRFGYDKELPVNEALVPAREAATRALSLNPKDTDALKAMSHIEHYDGNFERSIDYARQAVEANPNDPETIGNLGFMLGMRGRFSEAVPLLDRAIERSVSPAPRYYQMLALSHLMKRQWKDMLAAANLAAVDGMGVTYAFLAIAHAELGNRLATRENLEMAEERWPLLAEDPRAAFEVHKLDPALLDALVAGLKHAHAIASKQNSASR